MVKYRAKMAYDEGALKEIFWVECTDPRYGYPAVYIPDQPRFHSLAEAEEYAKKLTAEQPLIFLGKSPELP